MTCFYFREIVHSPLDKSKSSNGEKDSENISEVDLVNMMSALETRIAELELEKVQCRKKSSLSAAATPNHAVTISDIRSEVGHLASANLSSLGIPILDTVPSDIFEEGKMKSGYELKSQFRVKREIRWPHAHLGPIQHLCAAKPDTLDMQTFFYGYFMILNLALPESELRGRLEHGKELFYHAILHGWLSARRYHYRVLWAMEHDNLHWSDKEQLALLSMAAAQESNMLSLGNSLGNTVTPSTNASSSVSGSSKKKSILCFLYNNDPTGCKFEKSKDGCKKLHACSSCAEKVFFNNHSALECEK
jgi:hypothetical protein